MENNREVLLKVDHLCQYFRLGRKDLKAVDDVSFEIRKGESFGLVGESGCGKTTTGRSIIKLYDITSGNVYFKGQRIGAGTRSYKDAIAAARDDAAKKIKALRAEKDVDDVRKAAIQEEIKQINEELHAVVAKNRALIKDARSDSKEVDKQYVQTLLKALEEEYALKFRSAEGNDESLQNGDCLSDKCHRFFLLISCCFLKMGIKKKPRRCSALNLAVRLGSLRSAATGL